MGEVLTTISPTGAFDDPRYARIALDHAERYQHATPYPHIVLDDFLPRDLAHELAAAFPVGSDDSWIIRDNAGNRRRYQHDETKMPRPFREMLRELNARQFLLFLETLTGIDNLIPDPYYMGGGIHLSGRDGFLDIHADFNWHHKLQAFRRVNALLYFNEEWPDEWCGATELWHTDMSGRAVEVLPHFNRMLVFSTSEHSNHGQPVPNACPPGVQRKVLNLYYYTSARDDERGVVPHFTMYKSTDAVHDRTADDLGWETEASPFAVGLGDEFRRSAERAE